MITFGFGDGGGGPKEEFIEHALRLGNMEGMPKVRLGRADAFFERLAKHSDKLYHWVGELYLEMHRGTLTTQARTKRNNRKLEQLLAATEFICSLAPRESYPAEALDKAWKKLLINQFHDIIPGSSITKVYEVTEKEHAELFKVCEKLIADALETIGSADENAVSLINTLPYAYNAPVELPASWAGCAVTDGCGNEFKVQVEDGKVYAQGEIPADSVVVLRRGAPQEQPALETRRETVLENELVRYEFNAAGELVRGFDKEAGREILRDGEKGNVFSLYVDRPNTFEAWDVDIFYDQEERTGAEIKSISDVVSGPVRSRST